MLLQINNLQKTFKGREVLKNVDLSVEPGQLIHIIGENGSGKSTIFKIIGGIIDPDAGEVILDETINLGALIENPNFIEDESVKDNLLFLGSFKNDFDETKTRALLKRFDLDFDDKMKLKKYSIGMRQKVGIIQAVMEEQNLILLDEPTRGLDKKALMELKALINELIDDKKTVIVASHDNLSTLEFDSEFELEDGILKQV